MVLVVSHNLYPPQYCHFFLLGSQIREEKLQHPPKTKIWHGMQARTIRFGDRLGIVSWIGRMWPSGWEQGPLALEQRLENGTVSPFPSYHELSRPSSAWSYGKRA